MRVFETKDERYGCKKVNIVDENNVFVGYSFDAQCCEMFGYVFTDKDPSKGIDYTNKKNIDFKHEDFKFDTKYFKEFEGYYNSEANSVAFKLVNKDGNEIYLVLYNYHNGYYYHGFEMKIGDEIVKKGDL